MMDPRLKILVSAYACSPYQGSEAAVGWGFVTALARFHDLWVIVEEEKFRSDIERYVAEHPEHCSSIRFFFLLKKRNRPLRKLWPPSYYHYYRQWHEKAYQLAVNLHREVGFDLVHQLTMVGFREPGFLWRLGLPYVWGPIGGMGLFPWRFLASVGWYGGCYYLGYNIYNLLQMRFQKRPRVAALAAGAGLIAASPENQSAALRYWNCPSTLICEVGLPPVSLREPAPRHRNMPMRLVWTGLHTPGKALNLALVALSRLSPQLEWELHVLGKGRRTDAWKEMAAALGIAQRCFFHGWVERSRALEIMASSHAMLITSLRDLTSTVTIEALALGLPVICPDHCGFGAVVDATCGLKVPVTTPTRLVVGLTDAIERLILDLELHRSLAIGALRRSKDFAWEKKAATINRLYWEVSRRGGPP